jgi:hypothetical protein
MRFCAFVLLAMLLFVSIAARGDPLTLTAAEYFFDTDPGVGLATPLTMANTSDVIIWDQITATGLSPGLHVLYLRVRDSRGIWSPARGKSLRVSMETTLAQAEYYLDNDPGAGNGMILDFPDTSDAILFPIVSLPPTSPGLHTFYLRMRTTDGFWSSAKGKTLRIRPQSPGGVIFLAGGEAFFDYDPGIGHGIPLRANDGAFDGLDEFMYRNVLAETLTLGMYRVYARVQDGSGSWSNLLSDSVTIGGAETHRLVAFNKDSTKDSVRVCWANIGALEYRLHYDSSATGTFADYYTVVAPETTMVVPAVPPPGKKFYYVQGYWPETLSESPPLRATPHNSPAKAEGKSNEQNKGNQP